VEDTWSNRKKKGVQGMHRTTENELVWLWKVSTNIRDRDRDLGVAAAIFSSSFAHAQFAPDTLAYIAETIGRVETHKVKLHLVNVVNMMRFVAKVSMLVFPFSIALLLIFLHSIRREESLPSKAAVWRRHLEHQTGMTKAYFNNLCRKGGVFVQLAAAGSMLFLAIIAEAKCIPHFQDMSQEQVKLLCSLLVRPTGMHIAFTFTQDLY
jgi:hypothetical protein